MNIKINKNEMPFLVPNLRKAKCFPGENDDLTFLRKCTNKKTKTLL